MAGLDQAPRKLVAAVDKVAWHYRAICSEVSQRLQDRMHRAKGLKYTYNCVNKCWKISFEHVMQVGALEELSSTVIKQSRIQLIT
jgi:hypothetical protein